MNYYQVWVASSTYRRDEPLTYSYDGVLKPLTLVAVPLQNKTAIGIVDSITDKPKFAVRPIQAVIDDQQLPESLMELTRWLKSYYPASYGSILLSCLPSSLLKKPKSIKVQDDTIKVKSLSKLPPLTGQQQDAITTISSNPISSFLLHGETGSGKTRVYVEIAKKSFKKNRSVLIMTPEIGLTPQLVQVLKATFGERIVIFHSMLTPAERRSAWLKILHSSETMIVVGPRSAMFTPLKKIGLIVMDEAHETAYKQEQTPYYQTSRVAAKLAAIHKATFIMGTATPLVTDYYAYQQKKLPIIRLSAMAIENAIPPDVITVRLNDRDTFSRSAYISDPLIKGIEASLESQEQSLIYLNRRGSARVILCQTCGWQALCPNCDSPLTYHGDEHIMRCHICGFKDTAPSSCPVCANTDITFRSIGTKTVVSELSRILPSARIQRFDTDNSKHDRLEKVYEDVQKGRIDILVGTQILGKGLDLPGLSVVGIVQADTSLLIPDYTADETTYQQLVQIIGRVGRGHRKGKVFIQSHDPEGVTVQAAIKRDYRLFYESQLKERQLFNFPPFCYLLKLTCHRASQKSAEQAALALKGSLRSLGLPITVIGPSPAFHEKRDNQYYWQLVVKAKQRNSLLKIIEGLPSNWSYDIDPQNLL